MSALTEFLLARIAEDARAARVALSHPVNWLRMCDTIAERTDADVGLFVNDYHPTRALAECEAKRQIAAMHAEGARTDTGKSECDGCHDYWPCRTLRILAMFTPTTPTTTRGGGREAPAP